MKGELTWIELSRKKFHNNISAIRKLIGKNVLLAPCVKANAYGHGLLESASIFAKERCDWFCVDSADEAALLWQYGIRRPILIMGYVGQKDLYKAIDFDARVFLYSMKDAKVLSQEAQRKKKQALAHIKVDTGMCRQGITVNNLQPFLKEVSRLPNLHIEGIATHFACAGEVGEKRKHYDLQMKRFRAAAAFGQMILHKKLIIHCANSGALLTDPSSHCNMVRPGIALYGYYPSREVKKVALQKGVRLRPAMMLLSTIAQIKDVKKGECVGYGCTFIAYKNMRIAVLPIGYYDGLPWSLSNIGYVLIHGKKAKILGRICMNIMMADVTHIFQARVNDSAVIIGGEKRIKVEAEDLAAMAGTIHYEILTGLRESITKFIV